MKTNRKSRKSSNDVAGLEGAYDAGLLNPFQDVKIPKAGKHSQPTRYASLDDVLNMLAVLDDTSATVVALAAFSGLRKSEIQGLKWGDIHDGQINVMRTAWRTTKIIEDTKTDASRDAVPIIKTLAKHLEAHRNGHADEQHAFLAPKNKRKNRPLDLHNLANRVIRPALAQKSIPWPGWHGFRRGLATNLHTLGVADTDIQRILRHADVAITQRSYIKIEDKVRMAAMKKFEKALSVKLAARKKQFK